MTDERIKKATETALMITGLIECDPFSARHEQPYTNDVLEVCKTLLFVTEHPSVAQQIHCPSAAPAEEWEYYDDWHEGNARVWKRTKATATDPAGEWQRIPE